MSRDHPHRRPLIDLAASDHDLDVSDEEDTFYAVDEGDSLLSPKWRSIITRTTHRVPRRLQRYFVIYILIAVVLVISWFAYFGPQYAVYKQMEAASAQEPNKSTRPGFKDMVQVKDLEQEKLPSGDRRLVVVGDVHGCKKDLERLLKKVEFQEGKDHLILAGDFIAKGPDSPGVVSLAERLHASSVRGNHEDKVLLSIASYSAYRNPAVPRIDDSELVDYTPGANVTIASHDSPKLHGLAKAFNEAQVSYLKSCPVILRVGNVGSLHDVVVVHAGLVPDVPLEQQDPYQVMNMRTIDLHTLLPSESRDFRPWEKYWNHQQKKKPKQERMTVIYGHDSKRGRNIQKYSKGLDSGCVNGGHLTAMVIEGGGKHHYVRVSCKD